MQKYGLEGKIIYSSNHLSLFPPSIPKCYSYSCADYDCVWEERSPIAWIKASKLLYMYILKCKHCRQKNANVNEAITHN